MLQQSHIPLTNGIMSFVEASEDHELAPIGIGSMHKQAKKLAEYGRHGDIYFVHAAEGETVVPMEVLNANPKVKDMLFNQMREMGLDPDEFVVGNELNSINPVTGMPEFFLSSVWRSVKRAASSAWKGIKKAAPYVLPLVAAYFGVPGAAAGSLFGPGSFGATFLASGIGSLVKGDDWKTALRNAAIAGGTMAVGRGISNIGGKGGFMGGIGESFGVGPTGDFRLWGPQPSAEVGITMPSETQFDRQLYQPPDASALGDMSYGRLPSSQTPSVRGGAGHYLATRGGTAGQFGGGPPIGTNPSARIPLPSVAQGPGMSPTAGPWKVKSDSYLFPDEDLGFRPPAYDQQLVDDQVAELVARDAAKAAKLKDAYAGDIEFPSYEELRRSSEQPFWKQPPSEDLPSYKELIRSKPETSVWQDIKQGASDASDWYDENVGKYLQGGKTDKEWAEAQRTAGKEAAALADASGIKGTERVLMIRDAREAAGKGLWKYGKLGAYGGIAYGASKLFEGETDEERRLREIQEKEDDIRKKYKRDYARYDRNPGDYYVDLGLPRRQQQSRSSMFGAQGGLAEYPRRDLLVEGPGTERSDDIPAMLSDGEFVMNAKSVRGADPSGRGNRYAGASNLYNMMRNFEMRT